MTTATRYSLVGPEAARAVEAGLSGVKWFRSQVPRKRMKELMRRSDQPAIRDTAIWLGGMAAGAAGGIALWGSPWAIPCFAVHGVLYGSASDSRWHETQHGTAFANRKINDAVYQLASFFMMRDPVVWRWSHTRHHTDTLIVGRDPEIVAMRPARLARILANFLGLVDVPNALRDMVVHASGRLNEEEETFIPETERARVYRTARIWLGIYAATGATAVATGSVLPLVVIGGPRLYGATMHLVYGLTQHAGLGENVLDHRLNTRTVTMNRINRFLYWNMNYHVEHHMFPMVPYHRLPELHAEIAHDLAEPYPSIWAAYKELVPAVLRQLKDQSYYVRRELPAGATPYNEGGLMAWIPAVDVDDVDLEDVVPFTHDGADYAVYRSPDDRFYASAGHCTHERELLCDGLVMDGVIECPKHNGRFDYTTGKALGAPAIVDLPTFPAKVEDGVVLVDIP